MESELYSRLRSLIIARLIIGSTLLIGSALPLEMSQNYSTSRFLLRLITIILALSIIHSILLNWTRMHKTLAYIQIFSDIFLETFIVMSTGGIESPFSVLYILTIIVSSYLIPHRGAWVTSLFSSLIFILILILQYKRLGNILPESYGMVYSPELSLGISTTIVNIIGFNLTAFLSNRLSERLKNVNTMLKNRNEEYSSLLELNQRIVNGIPIGLITSNLDGTITSINPAGKRMLRISENPGKLNSLKDIFPHYLVNSILQLIDNDGKTERKIDFQKSFGDNEKQWFEMNIRTLPGTNTDSSKLILILRDITEKKQLEEARRKADRWSAIAEISAGMAHEIRNPLASISGSIEILHESLNISESESRLMNIIIRESERLNKLITDFLDLAREKTPEFTSIDVNKLLNETLELIQQSPDWNKDIRLVKTLSSKKTVIEADPNQITQVIWNLVKNANDAMRSGGSLSVTTQSITESNSDENFRHPIPPPYVKISIADTGIGISSEKLNRIFEPFTTYKRKGIGIGLAIVHKIIENHHGHISVTSIPGKGTTFEVYLRMHQNKLKDEVAA